MTLHLKLERFHKKMEANNATTFETAAKFDLNLLKIEQVGLNKFTKLSNKLLLQRCFCFVRKTDKGSRKLQLPYLIAQNSAVMQQLRYNLLFVKAIKPIWLN
ncbi:MAG: hypothetical protein IKJ01_08960 [Lachnospiraceae bacterium]|nr:hypothetical protein [Lachnospiraceae bacterium]